MRIAPCAKPRLRGTLTRTSRWVWVAAVLVGAFALPSNAAAISFSYNFDFAFGSQGTGPGQFSQPQGVAVDPSDGEVFVADTGNHRIQVFTSTGSFSRQWGSLGSGAGQMTNPAGVGVSPVAPFDVYVADTNDNRVERFTNDGTFISAFGTNGTGNGQVEFPRYITFDPQGNVYVGDTGFNQRITKWAADGTFQSVVGGLATFTRLGGMTASDRQIYATDSQANTLSGFVFAGNSGTGFPTGALNNPQGVGVDYDANSAAIFVADAGNHRIAVFGGAGPLLGSFGSLGSGEGQFTDPTGVAFSRVNNRLYVAEGNNCCTKISVWKQIPQPVLGKTMDIQTDAGVVLFRQPGQKKFKKLKKVSLIKSGTIIDARKGTVGITSVTATGALQSADFFKGIFKVVQKRQGKGLTDARLFGGNFKSCKRASGAKKPKQGRTVRQLWGDGNGQFRTTGRYLSAAVRGTAWQTIDTCNGSLVKVTQGSVLVTDFLNHKTAVVGAGGFYSVTAAHPG